MNPEDLVELGRLIDLRRDAFESLWAAGKRPELEPFLDSIPSGARAHLLRELLWVDVAWKRRSRIEVSSDDLQRRFPSEAGIVNEVLCRTVQDEERQGDIDTRRVRIRSAAGNLLYGFLGWEHGLLDSTNLLTTLGIWVRDKQRSLSELLLERRVISSEDHERLEAIFLQNVSSHHGDIESSLARLACWEELREELAELHDADIARSLAASSRFAAGEPESLATLAPQVNDGEVITDPIHRSRIQLTDSWNADRLTRFIGRYRIVRLLGEGAFGQVYLGIDEELRRDVAIKIPRPERFEKASDVDTYLAEARALAALDHPHIVPIYDVGRDSDGLIYLVSKFIEGANLAEWIRVTGGIFQRIVPLLADVADALHHAHQRQLIHRDVKPANILIDDRQNRAFVTDFGLAIREQDYVRDGVLVGTPAYMSPEQASGLGHRLDGRSDVFALGVILYEILAGRRAFQGGTRRDILQQVIEHDPPVPSVLNSQVPRELDRICQKAMAKRLSDRYVTAAAFAADLRGWEAPPTAARPVRELVPRGLRSFGTTDADYFLDLLPGPRHRNGLPESVQFWKTKIEERDQDDTFHVGLILGPSGCGKSSLVKAGILPHLDSGVRTVYVEATAHGTEGKLLARVQKSLPHLPPAETLAEQLAVHRRSGQGKLLLVIDQFEQWLHAHLGAPDPGLTTALCHCDGSTLQAILLVRDDFAMAVARFMKVVDVPIREGQNFATVDLFELPHAEYVLLQFGRALGKLQTPDGELRRADAEFLSAAIRGIAQENQIIPVRLVLFVEMMKQKPWTIESLRQFNGAVGIGVQYLEETLGDRAANPELRLRSRAARSVLRALVPEVGNDLKGHMRSARQLIEAAELEGKDREFEELIRLLDGDLRLITPADSGQEPDEHEPPASSRYYQLTHDYLVPALREWLTRKQKETRRGRAQLLLSERTSLWAHRPENQQLPNPLELANYLVFCPSRSQSTSQRRMLAAARHYYIRRIGWILALLLGVLWIGRELHVRNQATQRTNMLLAADGDTLVAAIEELRRYLPWARPRLVAELSRRAKSQVDEKRQLHARLALAVAGNDYDPEILTALLKADLKYLGLLRDALRPFRDKTRGELESVFRDEQADSSRRFRAGLALADDLRPTGQGTSLSRDLRPPQLSHARSLANRDGKSTHADQGFSWQISDFEFLALELTKFDAVDQPLLCDWLQAISGHLMPHLERIFLQADLPPREQQTVANAIVNFAGNDPDRIARLLTMATPNQYEILFPLINRSSSVRERQYLTKLLKQSLGDAAAWAEQGQLGKRQALAAMALMRHGARCGIPALQAPGNPEALSQFLASSRDRGITVRHILDCFKDHERATSAVDQRSQNAIATQLGLLLGLGEFRLSDVPSNDRKPLLDKLATMYADDPSSAIHSGCGWLLRNWGQLESVRVIDEKPLPYSPNREWFVIELPPQAEQQATITKKNLPPKFLTFVVFDPGVYTLGASQQELGREPEFFRHEVQIPQPFAIGDREITFEDLLAFQPDHFGKLMAAPSVRSLPQLPASGMTWLEATAYCRWLTEQCGLGEEDQIYPPTWPEGAPSNPAADESDSGASPESQATITTLDRRGFRLPTESEWEIACRGGAVTPFGFGIDPVLLGRYDWHSGNSDQRIHEPKQLRPNFRGLYDLHGNVQEWCHDWSGKVEAVRIVDRGGPELGNKRVVRGGHIHFRPPDCRSSGRSNYVPDHRGAVLGFRLAVSLPESH